MAKHQIIYTSCMRGIDGVNDGQQIFSYDRTFQDSKSDDIKSLFTYQVPSLPSGVIMSEEIAQTMPPAFLYRFLKNGSAAVTLNTYLGRDYMGSAGRFGNHLSHSIVCDFPDFDVYPCELYGSTALRSRMEYEEVNNPNPPEYLPIPELERGYVIDPDTVIEFLGIGENLEYLKQMTAAMLRFPSEKKRIVICDERGNIIKWIAALHYTLPLDIAKRVNITSYEYDPELSPAQICGVVSDGTRYNTEKYLSSGLHYVFDFIKGRFSDVHAEEEPLLFFLDTALSFSYESLTEFHDFVIGKTTYREADENYYAAFYLYDFLTEGINELTLEQFRRMVSFTETYVTDEIRREIVAKLIDERRKIGEIDNEYALTVLSYMLQVMSVLESSQQEDVKQMIVDRLIQSLSDPLITESVFIPLYDHLDSMARSIDLSIPAELMTQENRDALFQVLGKSAKVWKVVFIIRILSDYVKDMHLDAEELYPDRPIGNIYFQFVKSAFESGIQNGNTIVERILDNFKSDSMYYVNMTLNIEGYLSDLPIPPQDNHLWNYFLDYIVVTDDQYRNSVCRELLEYNRNQEVYSIYLRRMQTAGTLEDARRVFRYEYDHLFARYENYRGVYEKEALKEYENVFERKSRTVSEEEGLRYAEELVRIGMRMQAEEDCIAAPVAMVCNQISLEKLSVKERKMIEDFCDYYQKVLRRPVKGRLLLLTVGTALETADQRRDVERAVERLSKEIDSDGTEWKSLSSDELKKYFDWALKDALKCGLRAENYSQIYHLFTMSKSAHQAFMEYCCKAVYKQSKDDKDYEDFAEFLQFMFVNGTEEDEEMAGRYLCKLSKQKLEALDEEMRTYFKKDKKAMRAWDNVRETAADTNPLLNNLSGLFKRR